MTKTYACLFVDVCVYVWYGDVNAFLMRTTLKKDRLTNCSNLTCSTTLNNQLDFFVWQSDGGRSFLNIFAWLRGTNIALTQPAHGRLKKKRLLYFLYLLSQLELLLLRKKNT